MAAGMGLSVLIFAVALWRARRRPWAPRLVWWLGVFLSATVAGCLLGVAYDKMIHESLGVGGWLRWGALLAAGVLAPLLSASALMSGRPLPTFLDLIGPRGSRVTMLPHILLGLTLAVTTVIAAETALGFVFDPRYRDFPFASLTMAVVPFWTLMMFNRPRDGARPIAEAVFAALLAMSAIFIAFNEGPRNWQAMWSCAIYLLLAVTLWRARAVQSRG